MSLTLDDLTLERMRADVAAVLHESPDDIRDDDNLIDLGVDSLRALNLSLLWSEAVPLAFSDLAEHTTLAGWWGVVQARIAAERAARG
ncbi:MAG: phosphopantetheine-binding protein [Caulobacterales bacterium 68-7]|nr:MAG: phosphopantetheine-binding protein [Caulobacterales bacterium 68-7]